MSALQQFLAERVHRVPGARISFTEAYDAFIRWCAPEEGYRYTKRRFSKELREYYLVGSHGSGRKRWVGNCSLRPASPLPFVWTEFDGRLVKRRTKPRGNLCLRQLLPILRSMRNATPKKIATMLNERGKKNWRGNEFTAQHITRLLKTTI